ncbi:hypothetical protein [Vibrio owensii]|uniref:hypothetical protein n=1 Tax=Vibrio owensii TaxID=696485 RepID=UPI0038CEB2C1
MNQREFIEHALLGDKTAIDFVVKLFNISQIFDDLIDKDKSVSDEDIFRSYWVCLVELPKNPFYVRHAATLIPMMQIFLVDYRDSVILERERALKENEHGKNIAFVLRDSIGSIITHCAYLIGGYEHMANISVQVREVIFDESLEAYKEGLLCQEVTPPKS